MAGLSVPGFYYTTGTSSPVGMAAGFEAGADTAGKMLEREQQAQIRGRQERRTQEKQPLDLDALRAQTEASRAGAESTRATTEATRGAERRAQERQSLLLERDLITNAAARQGLTLTQQQIDDAVRLRRAFGDVPDIPALPSAAPRPAGVQPPAQFPVLPNVPLGGGGGDEALTPPAQDTPVGWTPASVGGTGGGQWRYVLVESETGGPPSYALRKVTPAFAANAAQLPVAPTERDRSVLGGIAPPFIPPPPPPAPPTEADAEAAAARTAKEETERRAATERTALAGLSTDMRMVQNTQRMDQIRAQHESLRGMFNLAKAQRNLEGMAKIREQALALQVEYAQRLSVQEIERLARTGDVSGVNAFLRAKSNGALSIEMAGNDKYIIFNNGVPSASGAVPRATMMTWLAAVFDPEIQAATAQVKALSAKAQEAIAAKAGDIKVEEAKGAQMAALKVVEAQNKGATITKIGETGNDIAVVDKGKVTVYRLQDVPGPAGQTKAYVAVPLQK